MPPDPREESIRRAYEAAKFDERTADERGFAVRFEDEFKPALVEGIGFNLRVLDARVRRRKIGMTVAALVAILLFPIAVLLNAPGKKMTEIVFYGLIFSWVLIWAWAFKKRPSDEDPNHALVIEQVLRQFGCRVGRASTMERLMPAASPIRPQWSRIDILDEHIAGRFDGRIPFVALRVKATEKQGKSTRVTFKGWYLHVELPFTFSGTTAVREERAPSYRYGTRIDTRTMSPVSLEDPEFARRFRVSSSDQVEARMVLAPDVMDHLKNESDRLEPEGKGLDPSGDLMLGFTENRAHVWLPSRATALSDWRPLEPARLIEDLHEAFAELSEIRAFLRDIDVIAESEGFRAQAAKNIRAA